MLEKKNQKRRSKQISQKSQKTGFQGGDPVSDGMQAKLRAAIRHHSKGELAVSEAMYRSVLKEFPNQPEALHFLGLAIHQSGRSEEAVKLLRKAVEIKPDYDAAFGNLGNALVALEKYDEAISNYREALEINPKSAELHNAIGIAYKSDGQREEAIVHYDQAIIIDPEYVEALNNKGTVLMDGLRFDGAIECFKRALVLNSNMSKLHKNLGHAYHRLGQFEEAIVSFKKAIQIAPENADTYFYLGNSENNFGHTEEAIDCFRSAIDLNSNVAKFHTGLGKIYIEQGLWELSVNEFKQAISVQPEYGDSYICLGDLLKEKGDRDEALEIYHKALTTNFEDPINHNLDASLIHNRIGLLNMNLGRQVEAVKSFRASIECNPKGVEAYANLAAIFVYSGAFEEADALFDAAIRIEPKNPTILSNKLFAAQYHLGQSAKSLYALACKWGQEHGLSSCSDWPIHQNDPDPDRMLRIGFVSGDLGHHPVGFIILNLLKSLSVRRMVTICYSTGLPNSGTEKIKASASIWRNVYEKSDGFISDLILADEIDILIDLSGHTGTTLPVFARKPAPIQISWAGWVGTTGLSAMDYVLSDKYSTLPDEEKYYTEKIIRMPDGWICFAPADTAPEVGPLPVKRNDYISFCAFCNPAKINEDVISVWSKIMTALPSSKLLIKYRGISSKLNQDRIWGLFNAEGINRSRVILEGWSPHSQLIARYNTIDIALDTFPYSGGVTTFEALWMGVPVVTMPGATFASRHSQSHLSTMGLMDLIAEDQDEYVKIAVDLASNVERLSNLRSRLRPMMAASPSCDGKLFADNFENQLRDVWRTWCATSGNGE